MTRRQLGAHIISVALVTCPMAGHAAPQQQAIALTSPVVDRPPAYRDYQLEMDRTSQMFRNLRSSLNRSTFDLAAVLDELDYDADEIVRFAKQAVAYEPYAGTLRGPLGTLFSRAGNALDQSLLLAKLLRDAGYEARIAGATLDTESAAKVLAAVKQPVVGPPPAADAEMALKSFQDMGLFGTPPDTAQTAALLREFNAPRSAPDSEIYARVEEISSYIVNQFESSDIELGSQTTDARLLAEAADYYWVEIRDAASAPWQDIHPIFSGGLPFPLPKAEEYFAESIPESLQHRFRFQVFIERKVGSRLEVVPLTTPWERPVANMVGVPLTFANATNNMADASAIGKKPEDLLKTADYYIPTFNGSLAEGAGFFDEHGTLIDPLGAQSSAGALFATIRDKFALSLGEVGDKSSVPTLTAQWMEFTLVEPGGESQTYQRMTFDRIGAANRRAGVVPSDLEPTTMEDARTLLQVHTLMVAPGLTPRAYVLDSLVDQFQRSRPGADALMAAHFGSPAISPGGQAGFADVPVSWPGQLGSLLMMDMANSIGAHHRNYRSGPALFVHRTGLGAKEGVIEGVDIVANPRRALDIRGELPVQDPQVAVRSGVWETAVEGKLLTRPGLSAWATFSKSDDRPIVLSSNDRSGLQALTPGVRAAIDADLAQGYAVLLGRNQQESELTWWRMDPRTGITLGQVQDGRGADIAETLFLMGAIIGGSLLGLALSGCPESVSTEGSLACCVIGNVLVSLFFVAFFAVTAGVVVDVTAPTFAELIANFLMGAHIDFGSYVFPMGSICETVINGSSR